MGIVYIVENLVSLQQGKSLTLALKTFQNRFLWDEEANKRFEREAIQWINLDLHPHVVFAFLVERIEGRSYLWLEFVDGESLVTLWVTLWWVTLWDSVSGTLWDGPAELFEKKLFIVTLWDGPAELFEKKLFIVHFLLITGLIGHLAPM